ncbi:MAG: sensor histidine kinase [Aggregatilineales bacterium]
MSESMTNGMTPSPDDQHEWERWMLIWHSILGVLLIITAGVAFAYPESGQNTPILSAMVLLFSGWYAGLVYWVRRWERNRLAYLWVYMLVGFAIWFGLTFINSDFMFLLSILFPLLYLSLPLRWAAAGAIVLSGLTIFRMFLFNVDDARSWIGFMAFLTLVGIALASFISDIIQQSERRKSLIDELDRTRRELVDTQHRAGVLEERQRLAQEIHDTLAQGFTSIVTLLEAAENTADDAQRASGYRHQAKETARDNLEEARRFVHDLQPQLLDNQPLKAAIQRLADRYFAETSVQAQFTVTGSPLPLHPAIEVVALRITQESLTNATKHACATVVNITLSYLDEQIILDIQDDGIGFESDKVNMGQGFGIIGMRRRVEHVGGTFTIESVAGEGTTIAAELPFKPLEGKDDDK